MRKITWIPLLIVVVGVCLALAGFANGGMKGFWFDRGGFQFATADRGNMVQVDEKYDGFNTIELNVDFLDKITFKEGDAFLVRGQNYERFGGLRVEKDGDKLRVNAKREGRWMNLDPGGWNSNNCWVEIIYPKGSTFDEVRGYISAGRISISNLDCETLFINNDFGDVEVNGVNAGDIIFNLSAGNAKIRSAAADIIDISNDFGKVSLESITANSLKLQISSGDMSADTVSTGDLIVRSDFGSVKFDRLELGGRGDITMSAGDVNIGMNMSEGELDYDLSAEVGRVTVDGKSGSSRSHSGGTSGASLSINSDFGAITLRFLN